MTALNDLSEQELAQAVALFYDGESAPVICATGEGEKAQEIIDAAMKHEIPLCDNEALINLLIRLELGDAIPESLYLSVAYIIALAYELQENVQEKAQE